MALFKQLIWKQYSHGGLLWFKVAQTCCINSVLI